MFEAYLGGHWWLFDSTRESRARLDRANGTGRDAAEVSFATIYGDFKPTTMRVWTNAEGAGGTQVPVSRERATAAVRTA